MQVEDFWKSIETIGLNRELILLHKGHVFPKESITKVFNSVIDSETYCSYCCCGAKRLYYLEANDGIRAFFEVVISVGCLCYQGHIETSSFSTLEEMKKHIAADKLIVTNNVLVKKTTRLIQDHLRRRGLLLVHKGSVYKLSEEDNILYYTPSQYIVMCMGIVFYVVDNEDEAKVSSFDNLSELKAQLLDDESARELFDFLFS